MLEIEIESIKKAKGSDKVKVDMEWQSRSLFWLQGLIIFLSSVFFTGYQVYSDNHAVQIPFIQWINNPSLFPNDPFISTLIHYIAPIYRVVAIMSNYVPLETLLLILFILTRSLFLVAAARLAMTIYPGSRLAAVGAMAFFALSPSPLIGHGTLVINYFEHTSLSIAFLLLATAAFYSKRPFYWALWLAIGFNLNIMYGTYACVYFTAVFLLDTCYRSNWKDWVLPGVLFVILASPMIVNTMSAFRIDAVDKQLWLRASEVRHPFHIYPLSWRPQQFYVFFAFTSCFILTLYLVKKELSRLYTHGTIWLAVSLFWLIFAFFAAYVAKAPAMLVMQPARGTDLWFAFAVIALIAIFAYLINDKIHHKRLYVILFFISFMWLNFFYFSLITIYIWAIIAVGVFWNPAWKFILKHGDAARLSNIVVLVVLFFAVFRISSLAKAGSIGDIIRLPDTQMMEIADWAREKTSIDDVFLVDPHWEEFRALSQRPVFVTWKDGTAMLWERSFVSEWVTRIESFGFNFMNTDQLGTTKGSSQLSRLYADMDDEDVTILLNRYPISFWVVPIDHPSSLPSVFQTRDFKVLNLNTK